MDTETKILIGADSQPIANILRAIFRDQGYNPMLARRGDEVLRLVHRQPPDLILLDGVLPGMDGIETCRRLKEEERTQLIPVIILTAPDQWEARVRGIEAGAADFLIKPIHRQDLMVRMRTALLVKKASDRKLGALLSIKNHLEKFAPVAVRRLVEENPEAPLLEKREEDLSVLFVDLSDYTKLSQRLAHTQVSTLIERYFSHFLDCILEEGGDVAELAGDGVMALFRDGDPQDHARHAARAALRILEVTERLNREPAGAGTPVAVHMGLNSGRAAVGVVRLEGARASRWTFTASGPVTNLAAWLADCAPPGTILAGPETKRRIGADFTSEEIETEPWKNLRLKFADAYV